MATKSSIHIKPCRVTSSGAHNRRTAEYMRNIGKSQIYIVPELTAGNEQWINPGFGNPDLQAHYDYIKRMVKEKTGRAMQEKERERKGKNGKITKVAGCSPIREGVLLIRPDTTLADVRKFGEECRRRWGITPLQIFLHKDEGHWLSGQPEAEDRESFKVGERWFKPNYHAQMRNKIHEPFKFIWSDIKSLHTHLTDEYDTINLSNIFEYMTPQQIHQTLASLRNHVRPGGTIIAQTGNWGIAHKITAYRDAVKKFKRWARIGCIRKDKTNINSEMIVILQRTR